MDYIYIGDLVNTHGIKGEVRIISDFKYKDKIFKIGFKLYIGNKYEKKIISTYRIHKMFDMVTFKGIDNINDVIIYKGDKVYINKNDLEIDGYLDEELIGLSVIYDKKVIGQIKSIMKNKLYNILVIEGTKRILVPNMSNFIEKIELNKQKIFIKNIEGLIDED